jgi:hypothetical protein
MAQRKFFVDLDLNKNQLKQARLENIAVSGVSSPGTGQVAFDTASNKLAFYNGASWEVVGQLSVDTVSYKGSIAYDASEPSPKDQGDMYIFSNGGTVVTPWWNGSGAVQAGDFIIYSGSAWDIIQKNVEAASESVAGYVQLATTNQTNDGTSDTLAVSPRNLTKFRLNKKLTSTYIVDPINLVANTGYPVTHGFNSTLVQVVVYDSTSTQIEVEVVVTSATVVTLTSTANINGCRVIVIAHDTTDPNV